jgi:hypothetical protein
MESRGAQVLGDLGFRLENLNRDAGAGQKERGAETDRPASGDHDFAIEPICHGQAPEC